MLCFARIVAFCNRMFVSASTVVWASSFWESSDCGEAQVAEQQIASPAKTDGRIFVVIFKVASLREAVQGFTLSDFDEICGGQSDRYSIRIGIELKQGSTALKFY